MWQRVGVVALTALVLCGCTSESDEAGFGVPKQPADAPLAGPRTEIRGTFHVESNGCWTLDTGSGEHRWIVWPADQEDDMGQPVLDGRVVADGDELSGTGAEASVDALPEQGTPDGYWGSYSSFCSAAQTGIVILDDVARA